MTHSSYCVRHKTCAAAATLQTSGSSPWPWNWDTLLLKLQKKNAALENQKDEWLKIPLQLQVRERERLRNKSCQSILMCTEGTAGLAVQPPWELGNCSTHSLGSGKTLCLVADFWVHCFTTSYFLGFVTSRKRQKQAKKPHSRKLKQALILIRFLHYSLCAGCFWGEGVRQNHCLAQKFSWMEYEICKRLDTARSPFAQTQNSPVLASSKAVTNAATTLTL